MVGSISVSLVVPEPTNVNVVIVVEWVKTMKVKQCAV